MAQFLRHGQVFASAAVALALVGGAYLLARDVRVPVRAQASTEAELLKAIAARDVDADGLPDWEESLYGTDASKRDTFNHGMTDGEAVARGLIVPKALTQVSSVLAPAGSEGSLGLPPPPQEGTLTAAFAQNFFSLYMAALQKSGDGNLSEAELKKVSDDALAQLAGSIVRSPDFRSLKTMRVEGSGPATLRSFAAQADAIFIANKNTATKSELLYLQDLVERNDAQATPNLVAIAKLYRATSAGLAVLPVPTELAPDYVSLINAMARLGDITEDFAAVANDPLVTMLALQQYPQELLDMGNSFIRIGNVYKTAGVAFEPDEPGAMFANFMNAVAAEQKSALTKP
ncbi:MAG: hypothetical protein WC030_01755 [Candidatus Paceibacterota bacterium]